MLSKAYLQHCKTNKLKEMLFLDAVSFNFSKRGSVNLTVRGIFALFISLSILNIIITKSIVYSF